LENGEDYLPAFMKQGETTWLPFADAPAGQSKRFGDLKNDIE
jgi:hypothetical protein